MALSTESMIFAALADHLIALTFSPPLPIAMPNVPYPASGQAKAANHLRLDFLPNQTRQITIGDDPQQKRGLLQVSVSWGSGQGVVKAYDVAGRIVGHFKNRVLWAGGIRITINNEPWAATPVQDDEALVVPVTIPWHAFEPEN